jgi:hypothetical protein
VAVTQPTEGPKVRESPDSLSPVPSLLTFRGRPTSVTTLLFRLAATGKQLSRLFSVWNMATTKKPSLSPLARRALCAPACGVSVKSPKPPLPIRALQRQFESPAQRWNGLILIVQSFPVERRQHPVATQSNWLDARGGR